MEQNIHMCEEEGGVGGVGGEEEEEGRSRRIRSNKEY